MLVFYKVDILYKVVQTDSFIRKFHFWDHSICFLGLHLYLWTRSSPLFTSPLQFPWVNLRKDPSFWKGHRLESSVAGTCTQDPDRLKQRRRFGAHWTFRPRRQWLEWHLCPWAPGFSPSLASALPDVCFMLSSRWWRDGARQHQASILPSSCSVAPHWLWLSDCAAVDEELWLWSLIHWWAGPKLRAHSGG